ncbi:MAG: flagellar hook-length control protein FliK [Treponema sp.]|jgi:flagellar hook-length control protein FliK|nr:flagellar hook-length control protein FliK [Treponema sp.]
MLVIEQNPPPVQHDVSRETEQSRFGGLKRKKGKKDALGVFAKLLAGLSVKKSASKDPAPRLAAKASPAGEGIPAENAALQDAGKKGLKAEKLKTADGTYLSRKEKPDLAGTEKDGNGAEQPVFAVAGMRPGAPPEPPKENTEIPHKIASLDNSGGGRAEKRGVSVRPLSAEDAAAGSEARQTKQEIALQIRAANRESDEQPPDVKKAEKRKDRITVLDLRTESGAAAGVEYRGLKNVETETRQEDGRQFAPGMGTERGGTEVETEAPQNAETGFGQILAEKLRGELSGDIVREASIVLRDGDQGVIRLSLKPETLGKVKIHLEMAENKISGHIFVESEEALRAFEQEIHSLEQAFRDSGFKGATLSTALDYRNSGHEWKGEEKLPYYSERLAVSGYDEASGVLTSDGSGGLYGVSSLVNVLA